MTRKRKVILGGLVLFLLFMIGMGFFYQQMSKLNKSQTDFVEHPNVTLEEEEDLDKISGTPDDLGEDYYYTDAQGKVAIYKKVPIDEDVFNVLFMGSDIRPDEKGNGRSDSMMLISYHWELNELKVISFLRDTWVAIPNHGWNRINAAYSFGGIGLAVNTVNENFDLDIQNYAIVEFDGLKEIVDQLGGIEVTLNLEEIKKLNSVYPNKAMPLKEGKYILNGDQTLTHSRNRSTGDGDFGRARRQRDVLMSMMVKMRSSLTPSKLPGFISKSLKYVDTNISTNQIFSLGLQLLKKGSYQVDTARVPFDDTWNYADKDGRSVVTIDLERNVELLHEYLYDEKIIP